MEGRGKRSKEREREDGRARVGSGETRKAGEIRERGVAVSKGVGASIYERERQAE